jgi:hypothetical protein
MLVPVSLNHAGGIFTVARNFYRSKAFLTALKALLQHIE